MKLLIVGGVAGGASAAARARRLSEDAHIIVFERGPDVSFANCGLPYYVGGEIAERKKLLVTTPEMLQSRFKLDVRTRSSVEAIDRTASRQLLPRCRSDDPQGAFRSLHREVAWRAGGVDKRIDVSAVAIQAGLSVFDLEEMELAYSPQYGSAKDPINKAGFVAGGLLRTASNIGGGYKTYNLFHPNGK